MKHIRPYVWLFCIVLLGCRTSPDFTASPDNLVGTWQIVRGTIDARADAFPLMRQIEFTSRGEFTCWPGIRGKDISFTGVCLPQQSTNSISVDLQSEGTYPPTITFTEIWTGDRRLPNSQGEFGMVKDVLIVRDHEGRERTYQRKTGSPTPNSSVRGIPRR